MRWYVFSIIILVLLAVSGLSVMLTDQIPETGYSATVTRIADVTNYKMAIEYNGTNVLYIGKALPNASKVAYVWQIQKVTSTGNLITDITYANGTSDFLFMWNNRTTYTYN